MRTYRLGDTITIEIELRDESGIQTAEMIFSMGQNTIIRMPYMGGEEQPGRITLTYQVTDQTAPGDYSLSAFYAVDGRGNRSDYPLSSDWNFRIEKGSVDTSGPELVSVNMR